MTRAVIVLALVAFVAACGGGGVATRSPDSAPASSGPSPDPASSTVPSAGTTGAAAVDPNIPRVCLGLTEPDCGRVVDAAAAHLTPGDMVVYIEVGPFGCPVESGCPNTLAARPAGQVVFERNDGDPVPVALEGTADGSIRAAPGESFMTSLGPSSIAGQLGPGGPIPYTLGHCGLGSGVDVDGSWWDPVGFVNIDHPDAINAADGTFTAIDPNHATFASVGGFTVDLVRRLGDKHLQLCM